MKKTPFLNLTKLKKIVKYIKQMKEIIKCSIRKYIKKPT